MHAQIWTKKCVRCPVNILLHSPFCMCCSRLRATSLGDCKGLPARICFLMPMLTQQQVLVRCWQPGSKHIAHLKPCKAGLEAFVKGRCWLLICRVSRLLTKCRPSKNTQDVRSRLASSTGVYAAMLGAVQPLLPDSAPGARHLVVFLPSGEGGCLWVIVMAGKLLRCFGVWLDYRIGAPDSRASTSG